jgi:nickel superoxide dismutase
MRMLTPRTTVSAHCDLPCGIYDPAQARIEAQSVKAMQEKYQANEDPVFRTRAIMIIGERADLVKHHISVLWGDYFKPPHFEKFPELEGLLNDTVKKASGTAAKQNMDPATGQDLLDSIDKVAEIFWKTKDKDYVLPQSA